MQRCDKKVLDVTEIWNLRSLKLILKYLMCCMKQANYRYFHSNLILYSKLYIRKQLQIS